MLALASLTEALDMRPEAGSDRFHSNLRRRRQDNPSLAVDNQAVLVALRNSNACNPVLRASAKAIIEELEL